MCTLFVHTHIYACSCFLCVLTQPNWVKTCEKYKTKRHKLKVHRKLYRRAGMVLYTCRITCIATIGKCERAALDCYKSLYAHSRHVFLRAQHRSQGTSRGKVGDTKASTGKANPYLMVFGGKQNFNLLLILP